MAITGPLLWLTALKTLTLKTLHFMITNNNHQLLKNCWDEFPFIFHLIILRWTERNFSSTNHPWTLAALATFNELPFFSAGFAKSSTKYQPIQSCKVKGIKKSLMATIILYSEGPVQKEITIFHFFFPKWMFCLFWCHKSPLSPQPCTCVPYCERTALGF